jgi:hypothetical protein
MLELRRAYLDNCTIGKVFFMGEFICYTIELPWKHNKKGESCIPSGFYQIGPYSSAAHEDCFYLGNPDLGVGPSEKFHRSYILIHPGNFTKDIEGCIAPGLALHPTTWGVADSVKAMDKLRALIKTNNIKEIEIS